MKRALLLFLSVLWPSSANSSLREYMLGCEYGWTDAHEDYKAGKLGQRYLVDVTDEEKGYMQCYRDASNKLTRGHSSKLRRLRRLKGGN